MPTGISAKHRRNSPTSLSNIFMDRYVKCCRLVANLACTVPASSDSVRSTILLTEHHVVEHDITVSKLPSLSEFSKILFADDTNNAFVVDPGSSDVGAY